MSDVSAEVLDDDVRLLRQVDVVQRDELGDGLLDLRRLVLGVVLDRLLQMKEGLVGRVVGEHVVDETLLDGLAHRVEAEELERLALWRGGECERADVWLVSACRYGG